MSGWEPPCGWWGDFAALSISEPDTIARTLDQRYAPRGPDQFAAWLDSLEILRATARGCIDTAPGSARYAAILEYRLPRDDRRPDVVVLENGTVLVIEFKQTKRATAADVDQVQGYARDLREYHDRCRDRVVVPILVVSGWRGGVEQRGEVLVTSPADLTASILERLSSEPPHTPDPVKWLRGRYKPLPSLVAAARMLFERESLPRIKRAESAGIPRARNRLVKIAQQARRGSSRRLVLLTGVPGSGKTLVGLSFAHSGRLERLVAPARRGSAAGVFLSGNGPLIEVLTYTLKNKVFVQSLKHYIEDHMLHSQAIPSEHVLVFDEAQRAWDAKKVSTKHRGKLGKRSEPALLLDIASRIPQWSVVVALIGEGQEIHVGEEGGLALWTEALAEHPDWVLHAPPRVAETLDAPSRIRTEPALDLDTTLRTHTAQDLHQWVGALLRGELDQARTFAERLGEYRLYVTRDLEHARRYVRQRYAGRSDPRYGLLASSCAENLRGFALRIKEDGISTGYGRWYEGTPSGRGYCCSLQTAVSEFGCQGLELDFAVPCWGDDLTWTGDRWMQQGGKKRRGAKAAVRLRRNAYRVLLTRGRDGLCVFVPPEPAELMDPVYDALRTSGARPLLDG
ncbi:MAG: DNA/RNA helicase domain-containing protein [Myxococcota bacterium]